MTQLQNNLSGPTAPAPNHYHRSRRMALRLYWTIWLVVPFSLKAVSDLEATDASIASELLDLAQEAFDSIDRPKHFAALYDTGGYALAVRVHLIRSARRSIDIQTFAWIDDASTRFLFSELVKAARRGVKIRLLIDHVAPFGKDIRSLAYMATAHENIGIRYFNPISKRALNGPATFASLTFTQFRLINRRMHNKLFLVDERVSILGGRNYENVYFDRNDSFNFKDRDIVLCGPVSQETDQSFELYWDHELSTPIDQFVDIQAALTDWRSSEPAYSEYFVFDSEPFDNIDVLANQYSIASHVPDGSIHEIGSVEFLYDSPLPSASGAFGSDSTHWDAVEAVLSQAQKSIIAQTPYLVASRRMKRLVKSLQEQKPDIELRFSTNSLSPHGHSPVGAVILKQQKLLVTKLKYRIYRYKSSPADVRSIAPRFHGSGDIAIPSYRIHAKSMVIDGKIAIVGSSNFDPRSEFLNSECSVIIRDAALAQSIEAEIRHDMAPRNSWVVAKRKPIPVIGHINGFIASVFRKLPILDFWPSHTTSCFALKEGAEPVAPDHPDFYDHYSDVGNFPATGSPSFTLETHLMKAAFGWAVPLM